MAGHVPRRLRNRGNRTSAAGKPASRPSPRPATTAKIPRQRDGRHDRKPRPTASRRRPSPVPTGGADRGRGGLRQTAFGLAAATGFACLLAVITYLGAAFTDRGDETADAVRAAKTAAVALFSYDYRDFDASIANASAHATGEFAEDYRVTTEDLRATVETEQAKVVARVVDIGLLNESVTFTDSEGTEYADAVEVLVFMDHVVTNTGIEGSKVDQTRVVLTMVFVDDAWRVVNAKSL
ncbi:Mce-associated membrane protein [Stackebrandtia albiflava]|uniref:Mce-associated membrane protein n=1 Tax=Stackebrandtia albiflava TaxID=406432 RepID=A0A562V3A5_9ACTN|nr:hypothetical protein [Stackebrandtia albiflava]TWJ12338.1 Mce-associated membrane protein [Stackebrandtia albiflava]